jgi:hypothetical protein
MGKSGLRAGRFNSASPTASHDRDENVLAAGRNGPGYRLLDREAGVQPATSGLCHHDRSSCPQPPKGGARCPT